jgi:hypothetical protein
MSWKVSCDWYPGEATDIEAKTWDKVIEALAGLSGEPPDHVRIWRTE